MSWGYMLQRAEYFFLSFKSNVNWNREALLDSVQFSSVAQSCLTLCDPMNRSMPGLPIHHQLPEFTQTRPSSSVIPSSHLILCRLLLLPPPIPPSIRVFSNESTLHMRSTGVSALASFLPKNTQDQSPLEWTDWISLQSIGIWLNMCGYCVI